MLYAIHLSTVVTLSSMLDGQRISLALPTAATSFRGVVLLTPEPTSKMVLRTKARVAVLPRVSGAGATPKQRNFKTWNLKRGMITMYRIYVSLSYGFLDLLVSTHR